MAKKLRFCECEGTCLSFYLGRMTVKQNDKKEEMNIEVYKCETCEKLRSVPDEGLREVERGGINIDKDRMNELMKQAMVLKYPVRKAK